MALLTTYSSANQVVTEGLTVKYSVEMDTFTSGSWQQILPNNPNAIHGAYLCMNDTNKQPA